MAKLYLFAIGGTGTRVLKSLTMLLASGMAANTEEIVPIVIDTDINNGDLEQFRRISSDYIKVHNTLFSNTSNTELKNHFFRTKLSTPRELNVSGLDYGTLGDMLDYSGMTASGHRETKFLVDLLFNQTDLTMKLENGFLGNPNIGSIVLHHIVNSKAFKDFTLDFHEGDRIFIINSIFGGTGAAGLPLLLKIFRESTSELNNIGLINSSIIGAVTVLPYFEVDVEKFQNKESAINSDTFVSKAKAALSYYEKHIGNLINCLYYIGDTQKSNYENFQGGTQQKNPGNLIEIAAAKAIIDFLDYEPQAKTIRELSKYSRYFEFGIDADSQQLNLKHLQEDRDDFGKSIIMFMYFAIYITNYFETAIINKSLAWKNELKIPESFSKNDFSIALNNFLSIHFYNWLIDLEYEKHGRRFSPFVNYFDHKREYEDNAESIKINITPEKLFTIVNEKPAKRNDKIFHKDAIKFNQIFTDLTSKTLNKNLSSTELRLMDVLRNGIEQIYYSRYKY